MPMSMTYNKLLLKSCCLLIFIITILAHKHLLTIDLYSVCLLLKIERVDIVIRYIEVDFTFRLPENVRYIEQFVISIFGISRFYSIHFTVTLAGTQNIFHYIKDFVK